MTSFWVRQVLLLLSGHDIVLQHCAAISLKGRVETLFLTREGHFIPSKEGWGGGLRLHLLSSLAVDVDEWLLFTDIVIKLVVGDSLQCDQIWPKFCRFGKIFKVYGNSLRVYFCIWQNFKPALSNFLWCVVKFSLLKYPNMGKIFSHMVTLVVVDQGEGETVSTLQNIFYRGSENRTIFLSKGTM